MKPSDTNQITCTMVVCSIWFSVVITALGYVEPG